jgi:hypothetical protein
MIKKNEVYIALSVIIGLFIVIFFCGWDESKKWEILTAIANTIIAVGIWFAYQQVKLSRKADERNSIISSAEFRDEFTREFFNEKSRILTMLFQFDLLTFKIHKADARDKDEDGFSFFELDSEALKKKVLLDEKLKALIQQSYTAYEVDDYLLGFFEDMGVYVNKAIIDIDLVYNTFSYYIDTIWKNKEIMRYIADERKSDKTVYCWFEYIYDRCKEHEKSLT